MASLPGNEKNAYEPKGKFLDDLHNNAFSGTNEEDVVEHIEYFLRIVDPIDLPNVNHNKLRVLVFPISLVGDAWKLFDEIKGSINSWVDLTVKFFRKYYPPSCTGGITTTMIKALWDYWKMGSNDTELTNEKGSDLEDECSSDVDETVKIFKIEDNLLDYKTPLCKAFNEFNYLHKIDTDLFIFEIQEIKTYEEYELDNNMRGNLRNHDIERFCNGGELPGMVQVGCITNFQDHKWYDELTDGKLKEEALTHKTRIDESWGDATPGVMKFCELLKNSFENFHELDYDVLVKLEECWWKVNAHEKAPFARWENYGQGPYANTKTKKDYEPYLDNNRIFEKIIKQTTPDDEEYVAIKENEYEDLTSTSEDACRAYQNIFRIMDEGWVVTRTE
ncbi:hypothetical protein Tco_1015452 [Tanacetum coccineum]|uniref:Transposase n=1 Tax=Tanacetum coccineum TaxID=301880 RepID=A0ABQ5FMP3_9ASTR